MFTPSPLNEILQASYFPLVVHYIHFLATHDSDYYLTTALDEYATNSIMMAAALLLIVSGLFAGWAKVSGDLPLWGGWLLGRWRSSPWSPQTAAQDSAQQRPSLIYPWPGGREGNTGEHHTQHCAQHRHSHPKEDRGDKRPWNANDTDL